MPVLETDGLTKYFGGIQALDSLSLQIQELELVGIIGPNGAGKTTFFNVITGFARPDSGYVKVRGKKISTLAPHTIVDMGVARTFQIVRPFYDMTVLENVVVACLSPRSRRMSAGKTVDECAWNVLEAVGLTHVAEGLPKILPHGELRRLELAKALATSPEILLLDEPLAGLGKEETDTVIGLVRKLREQRMTIVIIEHRLREIMQLSERIIVMERGRKIAEGTPHEVASDQSVIEAYIGKGIHVADNQEPHSTV